MGVPSPARFFRFGAFQLDLRARELRCNGVKVRVPAQSIQVLAMLLEYPGEVVTREELHARLWPNGTIVEFEHSINAAIKRLRHALEDSAGAPKYIETVPQVGYRFIGSMEPAVEQDGALSSEPVAADLELEDRSLSHYRIVEKLGTGGMGVVYRAQDTRLNRTVAIKMLSEDFSSHPQARERLEREAHAIASLNHPHICQLYDIGRRNGTDFLVLEYLDGETLACRLEKGPLPPEQILRFSIQMADALSAAHRQNVIHRDLKPGNLMLTKSGVKLLDFGLAKVRPDGGVIAGTELPTRGAPLTREGTILGTLNYMAPEQLEGKEADARTDIFALGAVIYETATGQPAFQGDSHASLVSAIMSAEPEPISRLRPVVPSALDHLVRTCLEKDPDARWQTAHDVLVELRWIAQTAGQAGTEPLKPSRVTRREAVAWACSGAAALTAAGLALWGFRRPTGQGGAVHFQVLPLHEMRLLINGDCGGNHAMISPDGRQLAWVAASEGKQALWLRALDSPEIRRLPNTENARMPFWSPDSRSLGFFANGRLKKIDTGNGTVQDLCDAHIGYGGTWNRDGVIVFSTYREPLQRIAAEGGEPTRLVDLDRQAGESFQIRPSFLPDGQHVLYATRRSGKPFISLASTESKRTQPLVSGADLAMCVDPGFIVFHAGDSLRAQAFDTRKLRLTGEPRQIAEHVDSFSVSPGGVLAYHTNPSVVLQFRWYSRNGARLSDIGSPGEYKNFALSPDGRRLAVVKIAEAPLPATDIWVLDLANGVVSRLTSSDAGDPLWSADGRRLIFTSSQNGRYCLFMKDIASGHEELLFSAEEGLFAKSRSHDGSFVITVCGLGFGRLPIGGSQTQEIFLRSDFDKDMPSLSPNGQLFAWDDSESGRWEVYLASFPGMTEKVQVSTGGGCQPRWRGDGKELFYLGLDGRLMAVDVNAGSTLSTGPPRALFQTGIRTSGFVDQYCPASDGQRFFLADPMDQVPDAITVVVNWTAGVRV